MEAHVPVDADAPEDRTKTPKTRRRTPAKAPVENAKRSLNLRIDEDSYRRLSVHALMRNRTISELVMEFAQAHLREYSVHRNGARSEQAE